VAGARGGVVKKLQVSREEGVAVRRSGRGKERSNCRKELARLRKKRSEGVGKNGKGQREKLLEKLNAAGRIFHKAKRKRRRVPTKS